MLPDVPAPQRSRIAIALWLASVWIGLQVMTQRVGLYADDFVWLEDARSIVAAGGWPLLDHRDHPCGAFSPLGRLYYAGAHLLLGSSEPGWRLLHTSLMTGTTAIVAWALVNAKVRPSLAFPAATMIPIASGVPTPAAWISTAPYLMLVALVATTQVAVQERRTSAPFWVLLTAATREPAVLLLLPILERHRASPASWMAATVGMAVQGVVWSERVHQLATEMTRAPQSVSELGGVGLWTPIHTPGATALGTAICVTWTATLVLLERRMSIAALAWLLPVGVFGHWLEPTGRHVWFATVVACVLTAVHLEPIWSAVPSSRQKLVAVLGGFTAMVWAIAAVQNTSDCTLAASQAADDIQIAIRKAVKTGAPQPVPAARCDHPTMPTFIAEYMLPNHQNAELTPAGITVHGTGPVW